MAKYQLFLWLPRTNGLFYDTGEKKCRYIYRKNIQPQKNIFLIQQKKLTWCTFRTDAFLFTRNQHKSLISCRPSKKWHSCSNMFFCSDCIPHLSGRKTIVTR